jgi:hypothetical protein
MRSTPFCNCTLSLSDATGKSVVSDAHVFAGVKTKLSTKHVAEGMHFAKFYGGLRTGYLAPTATRQANLGDGVNRGV